MLNYDMTKILTNLREAMCQGSCEQHKGDINYVHVVGNRVDVKDVYCEEAIEEDRRRGFTVMVIFPESPTQPPKGE